MERTNHSNFPECSTCRANRQEKERNILARAPRAVRDATSAKQVAHVRECHSERDITSGWVREANRSATQLAELDDKLGSWWNFLPMPPGGRFSKATSSRSPAMLMRLAPVPLSRALAVLDSRNWSMSPSGVTTLDAWPWGTPHAALASPRGLGGGMDPTDGAFFVQVALQAMLDGKPIPWLRQLLQSSAAVPWNRQQLRMHGILCFTLSPRQVWKAQHICDDTLPANGWYADRLRA